MAHQSGQGVRHPATGIAFTPELIVSELVTNAVR
ncbi:hypothetical protein QFZ67_000297 [Streptomyces sp. V1I1]|nr:hypothetical protein [Streptomyces sp. V1I1]